MFIVSTMAVLEKVISLHGNFACILWVIYQFSPNAHHFSTEDAINSAQDFYRIQKSCSSIELKYFGQLPVEIPVLPSISCIILCHIKSVC